MNKIDEAWQVLKKLPPEDQERMAEVILDFAAQAADVQLSDEQVAEIEARKQDSAAPTMTIEDVRAHFKNRAS